MKSLKLYADHIYRHAVVMVTRICQQIIQSWEFSRRFLLCTMPLTKIPKKREPLWKEWNYNADKRGVRSTVYSVNGDQYTGEWENNKKNGKKM